MSVYTLDASLVADVPASKQYRYPDDLYTQMLADGGTGHEIVVKTGVYRAKASIWFRDFVQVAGTWIHWDGVGARPEFHGVVIDNAGATGWALVSGSTTVWKKVMADTPTGYARRVFRDCSDSGGTTVGSITVGGGLLVTSSSDSAPTVPMVDNTTNSEATILAAVSAARPCFCSDAAALGYATYIWTGSATIDPPTYYNGIGVLQPGTGTTRGRTSPPRFGVRNAAGIRLGTRSADAFPLSSQGFDIWGTYADGFGGTSTNTSSTDLTIDDCGVYYWARRGMYFSRDATEANAWLRMTALFCRIERGNTAGEVDALTSSPNDHGAEGVDMNKGMTDSYFDWGYVASGSHGGCTLTSGKPADPILRCGFRNNVIWTNSYELDSRAFTSQYADACIFEGNIIFNQRVRSQFRGNVTIRGNWWIDPTDSVSQPTSGNGQSVLYFSALSTDNGTGGGSSTHDDKPVNIVCEYNVVIGSVVNFARMFAVAGETLDANSVTLRKNLVQMLDTSKYFIEQFGGGTINEQIVTDNHVEMAGTPQVEVLGALQNLVGLATSGYARNSAGPLRSTARRDLAGARHDITTAPRSIRLGLPA